MSSIVDRISVLASKKDLPISALEKKIGASNGTLSKPINGIGAKNNIGVLWIEKILKAFPDVSPEWMMLGTGDMYKGAPPTAADGIKQMENKLKEHDLKLAEKEREITEVYSMVNELRKRVTAIEG